uniref:Post-glycosylphosphatidylinositol attachment to proteins 6 n=1 Tax=Oryzias sinensis TaxID=183150 RepID=A0A8C8DSE4_9TELE
MAELSSRPAQKLSKYGWYGNVRLQRFHIPEETAIARWTFTVTRGNSFYCGQHNVTVYIRWGAPPVINPTDCVFPNGTLWNPSLSLILPVISQNSTMFNLSDPAPGEWFVAAHLPEDDGRIEQKGFPSCTYFFQPQLSVRRAVDTPVLPQDAFLTQTASFEQPARLKLFVPEFASSLSVSVRDCSSGEAAESGNCWLLLSLGSASLLQRPVTVNCSGMSCSASLVNPPWDTWLRVVVESSQVNRSMTFRITWSYTEGCKPRSVGLEGGDEFKKPQNSSSQSNSTSANTTEVSNGFSFANKSSALPTSLTVSACMWSVPVLYEEVDVLSLRFTAANGSNVSVTDTHPTLLTYPLPSQATGGTLNLKTQNDHVFVGCSSTLPCSEMFCIYEVMAWASLMSRVCYASFSSSCGNASVVSVVPELSVSACVEDCGSYGECRLLRSYSYLYAGCVCKAGWKGWGCTDYSSALSYGRQLLSTLLLTLSNLSFLPAIVVATRRFYITEASVYCFTMFFSTFYHACDQPGVAVLCIMDYDALQYCDFLGSVCSIWVTILCMAQIRAIAKYTLFMLGALLIAMSMQLDRKGLWNMLGPILCAILLMASTWVYRGVRRRHCYPPSWKRWAFYLIPGLCCALVGVCLYIFAETEDNYYYTHSLWHILVATCVVFLLPPEEKQREALGWSRGFRWRWSWRPQICGYTLCESSKQELYTVT